MRKPMVTRLIPTYRYTLKVIYIKEERIATVLVEVSRSISDKQLIKQVEQENPNTKVLDILSRKTKDVLYGMSLDDFINHAEILDRATRKPIEKKSESEVK